MTEFPKWLYKDGAAQLVADAAAERALGPGWAENPSGQPDAPLTGMAAPAPSPSLPVAYEPVEYPKWLYQAGSPAVLVKDASEAGALGPGWYEDPDTAARMAQTVAPSMETPQPAKRAAKPKG